MQLQTAWMALMTVVHSVACVPSPYFEETFTFLLVKVLNGSGNDLP
jgi:hypothetical protein